MKSDHVTNNMTESLNKWVDEVRDKPILTILEHIRRQLMVRMLEKYKQGEDWQDRLTPYAREKLNQFSNEARRIKVFRGMGSCLNVVKLTVETFSYILQMVSANVGCGKLVDYLTNMQWLLFFIREGNLRIMCIII